MEQEKQQTENATVVMSRLLDLLSKTTLTETAREIVAGAQDLMKGKALVQKELNGALAINLSVLEHLSIILPDGPTESQQQDYRDFVHFASEAS